MACTMALRRMDILSWMAVYSERSVHLDCLFPDSIDYIELCQQEEERHKISDGLFIICRFYSPLRYDPFPGCDDVLGADVSTECPCAFLYRMCEYFDRVLSF